MDLNQQTVLVTGGASGMGKACALRFHERGAKVVIWDRQLNQVALPAIQCDVRDEASVKQALAQTVEQFGVPRVCINCAGVLSARRMVGKEGAMPLDVFKQVIDVNLIGTFNVMRLVAEMMITLLPLTDSLERGVIINTASVAAYEGQIGQMAYSASKGGVVAMTLPAARELAQHGIRVNTIAPGLMATPMLLNMPEEVQANLIATSLYPKRLGRPDEFAALAEHIIENQFINGEVIRLDGGIRLQPRA